MRSDTGSGTEKYRVGTAEENAPATESTYSVSHHERLTESIQRYFGASRDQDAREQAEHEADQHAAFSRP